MTVTADNVSINISDIKNIRENMTNILWGKGGYISADTPCFMINRYQQSANGISLYFTDCELTVSDGGITAVCDYR